MIKDYFPFNNFTNEILNKQKKGAEIYKGATIENQPNSQMPDAMPMPQQEGPFVPEVITSPLYLQGYLLTQVGKSVTIDFLIGNQLQSRSGVLDEVGTSYIVLLRPDGVHELGDLYSIKFVTILPGASSLR